jgi:hypothetical protein
MMKSDQPSSTPSPSAESFALPGEGPNHAATGARSALRLSKKRLALAFAIAAISDVLGGVVTLAPPLVWAVDAVTAVLLFGVLGWHWLLLPGLLMEAIPGVAVLPFWLLVVGAIAVWGTPRPKLRTESVPRPGS